MAFVAMVSMVIQEKDAPAKTRAQKKLPTRPRQSLPFCLIQACILALIPLRPSLFPL